MTESEVDGWVYLHLDTLVKKYLVEMKMGSLRGRKKDLGQQSVLHFGCTYLLLTSVVQPWGTTRKILT